VTVAPGRTSRLFGMLELEQALPALLTGLGVDLGNKRSRNRWITARRLQDAMVLYDAA